MKQLKPVVVLFAICVVVTALVACVNEVTKDAIAQSAAASEQAAMNELIPGAQFTWLETRAFTTPNVKAAYAADKNGERAGYIILAEGEGGYGGLVPVMIALDQNGVVLGLSINADSETPGLGQNAVKKDFWGQYVGKSVDSYTVVKNDPANESEIRAVTGATKTSRAVTDAVNRAKQAYAQLAGGDRS